MWRRQILAAFFVVALFGGLWEGSAHLGADDTQLNQPIKSSPGNPLSGIERILLEPSVIRAEESIEAFELIIKHSEDSRDYKADLEAFGMKDNSSPVIACAMIDVGEARVADFKKLIERMQTYVLDVADDLEGD